MSNITAKILKADADSVTASIEGLINDKPYTIRVVAHNNGRGASNPSNPIVCSASNANSCASPPETPLVAPKYWESSTYYYAIFESGETTGYEALRTEAGANTEFEVLLLGAGGSGKGQTLMGGKGGDGGGGQLVITKLPIAGHAGSIFVTVPNGGKYNTDSPANTTVKEGTTTLTAVAGKSATDKNDAAGEGKQTVPDGWCDLSMFTWLLPGSRQVGGTAQSFEQNYPNATFAGEGGAGTKDNRPGFGNDSYVAIRWKK